MNRHMLTVDCSRGEGRACAQVWFRRDTESGCGFRRCTAYIFVQRIRPAALSSVSNDAFLSLASESGAHLNVNDGGSVLQGAS